MDGGEPADPGQSVEFIHFNCMLKCAPAAGGRPLSLGRNRAGAWGSSGLAHGGPPGLVPVGLAH